MGRPKGFAAVTDKMNPEIHKEISRLGGLMNKKRHVFTPEQRARGGRAKGPKANVAAEAAAIREAAGISMSDIQEAVASGNGAEIARQLVQTQGLEAAMAVLDRLRTNFDAECAAKGIMTPDEAAAAQEGVLSRLVSSAARIVTRPSSPSSPATSLESPAELAARLRAESAAMPAEGRPPASRLAELKRMREQIMASRPTAPAAGLDEDDFD